jgi:hypothetical protein
LANHLAPSPCSDAGGDICLRRKEEEAKNQLQAAELNQKIVATRAKGEADFQRRLDRYSRQQEGARRLLAMSGEHDMAKAREELKEAQRQARLAKVEESKLKVAWPKVDEKKVWKEENKQTQKVLSIMRRAGYKEAVNPPLGTSSDPFNEEIPQHYRYVTLRPNKTETLVIDSKRWMHKVLDKYFNVDLQRYRSVEVIKAEGIGDRGAAMLGFIFSQGHCGELRTLHLQENEMGRLGLEALAKAFTKGAVKKLEALHLQGNNITGRAVGALSEALKAGALPCLKVLDLRSNQIKDHGASSLAAAFMSEKLQKLERVMLQNCDIHDPGAYALYAAVTLEVKRYCPSLKFLSIIRNRVSPQMMRSFRPSPAFFQY